MKISISRDLSLVVKLYWFFYLLLIPVIVFSQTEGFAPSVNPKTPTAYQFTKFGDIEVDEYHGIPDISIPLYTIKSGDLEFPLILKYHAGGIKVGEEASWVGLGWDLSVGNIVQIVNDKDDLGNYTRILPDYFDFGSPAEFPWLYTYCPMVVQYPYGVPSASIGISQSDPRYSLVTFTDYYVPVNGIYSVKQYGLFNASGWTNGDLVDSEPDVFKATFNGHYLEFVIDFSTNSIEILNNEGYKIEMRTLTTGKKGWDIIAPDGITYSFEDATESFNMLSRTKSLAGDFTYSDPDNGLVSRIWHLKKITGIDNRTIDFNWYQSNPIYEFPSFYQTLKYKHKTYSSNTQTVGPSHVSFIVGIGPPNGKTTSPAVPGSNPILYDYGFSTSKIKTIKQYLGSITFSGNEILFFTSDNRSDLINDRKLNLIEIYNSNNKLVCRYDFTYDYFNSNTSGSNYNDDASALYFKSNDEIAKRLKLISLTKSGENPYIFTYNGTLLPLKSSFATDFWGYFNGKLSNSSFIPNPLLFGYTEVGDNGNDRMSDIDYAKAACLEKITYPTKGETEFQYELNEFEPNQVSTINNGNGLRIKSIQTTDNNAFISKLNYSYDGGISLSPQVYADDYTEDYLTDYSGYQFLISHISIISIRSSSFNNTTLFGSGEGVGYTKVTKEIVDNNDNGFGKTITTYYNHQDEFNPYTYDGSDLQLPTAKKRNIPANGLIQYQEKKDANGNTINFIENDYQFKMSKVYYGARITHKGDICCTTPNGELSTWEQNQIGYYPIYSGYTQLNYSKTKNYTDQGVVNDDKYFEYNAYNLIETNKSKDSRDRWNITNYHYPTECNSGSGYWYELKLKNIINKPFSVENFIDDLFMKRTTTYYSDFNGLILPSMIKETPVDETRYYSSNDIISYDNYDDNGNILEYHKVGDTKTNYLWGYNNAYVIAEIKNATENEYGYTGFEDPSINGWEYLYGSCTSPILNNPSIAFTGNSCFTCNGVTKNFTVGKESLKHNGYKLGVWIKSTNSEQVTLKISVLSDPSIYVINTVTVNNQWSYYEVLMPYMKYSSLEIDGSFKFKAEIQNSSTSVYIDDVRFSPMDAEMTTYTYEPLIGMTSASDVNNKPTYYEYDAFGRLSIIKDYLGNILKKFDYHYRPQ